MLGAQMHVHCLRHGETENNLSGRFHGTSDESLTDPQKEILLASQLDISVYDAIYCSPLPRCIETAECLRISHFLVDTRLKERKFGIFEGLTAAECKQQYPYDFSRFMSFDGNFIIPNGESRVHHFERLCSWLRDISTFSNVLAITHGGSIDFLYRLGTNIPLHGGDRIFSSNNATLSIFEVNFPDVRLIDNSVPLLT